MFCLTACSSVKEKPGFIWDILELYVPYTSSKCEAQNFGCIVIALLLPWTWFSFYLLLAMPTNYKTKRPWMLGNLETLKLFSLLDQVIKQLFS